MKAFLPFLLSCVVFSATVTQAQDLVHQPINPSFGGDSFNSAHLLGLADIQNQYDGVNFQPTDPIDAFAASIERRILGEVSRQISDRIFGEEAQESGEFTVGDTKIAFAREGLDQIGIQLIDIETGAETALLIPAPAF